MVEEAGITRRLYGALVFCTCALVLCLAGPWPVAGAQPARTLPLKIPASPPVPAPKKPAAGAAAGQKAKTGSSTSARKGNKAFSGNPLALERHTPADERKKAKVVYGPEGQRREKPVALGDEGKLVMSSKKKTVPESRLTPERTTFSGSAHTLPYMDSEAPPEVSMRYKVQKNTTTRLTINPQDASSPLYRPAESDGTVNSAGVYVDMDVQPDVQLQVGGEYCDVESRNAPAGSSQGVSMGLKWHF